jgi:hypothetical protein
MPTLRYLPFPFYPDFEVSPKFGKFTIKYNLLSAIQWTEVSIYSNYVSIVSPFPIDITIDQQLIIGKITKLNIKRYIEKLYIRRTLPYPLSEHLVIVLYGSPEFFEFTSKAEDSNYECHYMIDLPIGQTTGIILINHAILLPDIVQFKLSQVSFKMTLLGNFYDNPETGTNKTIRFITIDDLPAVHNFWATMQTNTSTIPVLLYDFSNPIILPPEYAIRVTRDASASLIYFNASLTGRIIFQ